MKSFLKLIWLWRLLFFLWSALEALWTVLMELLLRPKLRPNIPVRWIGSEEGQRVRAYQQGEGQEVWSRQGAPPQRLSESSSSSPSCSPLLCRTAGQEYLCNNTTSPLPPLRTPENTTQHCSTAIVTRSIWEQSLKAFRLSSIGCRHFKGDVDFKTLPSSLAIPSWQVNLVISKTHIFNCLLLIKLHIKSRQL